MTRVRAAWKDLNKAGDDEDDNDDEGHNGDGWDGGDGELCWGF